MSRVCLACREVYAEEKRFCRKCGAALAPGDEAVAVLRARLASSADDEALDVLLAVLQSASPGSQVEAAELRLSWCEGALGAGRAGGEWDVIRARLHEACRSALPPGLLARLAGCLIRLHGEAPQAAALVEDARVFAEVAAGHADEEARSLWAEACMNWGRSLEVARDVAAASAVYESALAVGPGRSEIREAHERLRRARGRTRTVIASAVIGALVLLGGGAWLVWYLTTAWVEVTVPAAAQVTLREGAGVNRSLVPALGSLYGLKVLGARLPRGSVRLTVRMEGYFAWDSMLVLPGGHRTRIQPALRTGYASFVISSKPAAAVVIDGQPRGRTPLSVPHLQMGRHTIELTAALYRPWGRALDVEPDKPIVLAVDLEALLTGHWKHEEGSRDYSIWVLRQEGGVISGFVEENDPYGSGSISGRIDSTGQIHITYVEHGWYTNTDYFVGGVDPGGEAVTGECTGGEGAAWSLGTRTKRPWHLKRLQ